MTEGFDFESWLEEAQTGLEHLKAKRESLVAEQETIKIALEDTDKEIGALASMLDAYIGSSPASAPEAEPERAARVTGIKKTAKRIAGELTIGVDWTIAQLIEMVQKEVPGAPEKSCRSAIQALAKDGVFIQSGQRGAWSYSSTIGKNPTEEPQEPAESAEETKAPEVADSAEGQESAKEAPAQGSLLDLSEEPSPAEVVVVGVAEVIVAIEKEMKKRKSLAMAEKNIGWIAADLHCDPKVVRDALKLMVEGDWELAYEGDQKVLRRKAEPGSREELKRTHIKDQPLFPDADRPPHA